MLTISTVDLRDASDGDYADLNALANVMRAERDPEEPPVPLAESVARFRSLPDFIAIDAWVARLPGRAGIVASGHFQRLLTAENAHLGEMLIDVAPEYRRQGIGRRLLEEVVAAAERNGRRLLVAATVDRVPAGEAFVQRIGASKAMEAHTNQLEISELDLGLLDTWIAEAADGARDFDLEFWDGPYPEDDLADIARLMDVMNDAPLGDLEVEDMHTTPEQVRQMERLMLNSGAEHWTMFVRHRDSHRFAGFTDVSWHRNRPHILKQGSTGVLPEYRGHGLGKWLKAAMLRKVVAERPTVRIVRTGNADSNAAMLHINNQLGFRPYMAQAFWQLETARARAYLNGEAMVPDSRDP